MHYTNKIFSLQYFILFLFINISILPQNLAEFGNSNISIDDFRRKFELNPSPTTNKNSDSVKTDFLFSMITEEIWAKEGIELSLDTTEYVRSNVKFIEKMLLRDYLYKNEVLDKIVITDREIDEAIAKSSVIIFSEYFLSKSEATINDIYSKLLNNNNLWDSLKSQIDSVNLFVDTISVTFGKMEKQIEDVVFSLDKNQISAPFYTKIGWLIIKNVGIKRNTDPDLISEGTAKKKVSKILSKRKEDEQSNKIYKQILLNNVVNVDILLFDKLCESLSKNMKLYNSGDAQKLNFVTDLVYQKVREELQTDLNSDYIKFEENPISLNDYLNDLQNIGIKFSTLERFPLQNELHSIQKEYIIQQIFTRFAEKSNIGNYPEVQKELEEWKKHFTANYYIHMYNDSVQIDQNSENQIITILTTEEVISDDILKINLFHKQLSNSENFKEESQKNSLFWREKEYSSNDLSNFGVNVDSLKIGDIIGPIYANNFFHLIKINKRTTKNIGTENQFNSKIKSKLKEKTEQLAEKYNVKINRELLKSVSTTEVKMVVFRNIGFGGKMLATPFLKDYSQFIKEYFTKSKEKSKA